jgi:hypothetical protein
MATQILVGGMVAVYLFVVVFVLNAVMRTVVVRLGPPEGAYPHRVGTQLPRVPE